MVRVRVLEFLIGQGEYDKNKGLYFVWGPRSPHPQWHQWTLLVFFKEDVFHAKTLRALDVIVVCRLLPVQLAWAHLIQD